uniref:Guanine nucleotide-binding protein subunit beta-like protein n=1 Tax=Trypanosoma congolense (strain IL3000) TaxID=1068625 RepID=G0UXR8_TRYCI|nr:conserved hypothetical protein [Trypanosoma congolense IL3000]
MSGSESDSYDPAETSVRGAATTGEAPKHGTDYTAAASREGGLDIPPSSRYASAQQGLTSTPVLGRQAENALIPKLEDHSHSSMSNFLLRGTNGRVRSLCVSPDGSILCSGSECGSVCFWDFAVPLTNRLVKPTRVLTPFPNRISGFQSVISVHSSSDGSYFVACQDGDSPVIISSGGKQQGYCAIGQRGMIDVVQCKGHRGPVTCSAPSPDMASRFFTGSQDSTARMWDAASFEQHSVYAVKHGSGQLMENVVVETVLPLRGTTNNKTSVFATGGEDGLVQLWDTRQKYRPGGAFAFLDMYNCRDLSASKTVGQSGGRFAHDLFVEEKHIGGMTEPNPSCPTLCVRCGSTVRIVDLRRATTNGVVVDVSPPLTDLPSVTDTGPLVSCTSEHLSMGRPSFLVCTDRRGYRHIAGGHVVQVDLTDGRYEPSMVWMPASADDDVLSVAFDTVHGQLFAGLQSGAVVGRMKYVGVDVKDAGPSVRTWLATQPKRAESSVRRKRERTSAPDDEDDMRF